MLKKFLYWVGWYKKQDWNCLLNPTEPDWGCNE